MRHFLKLLMLISCFAPLMACIGTTHSGYQAKGGSAMPYERHVEFELSESYYAHAPRCITVMDMDAGKSSAVGKFDQLEEAFARHLHGKVNAVIGPKDRDVLVRTMAVDLSHPQDRKAFARNLRCNYFLSLRPLNDDGDYLFFWSREAVGAEAVLTSVDDTEILWKSRHVADRQDGGLPLTPLAAAFSIFEASSLSVDSDVNASLSDDLARRVLATLPGLRDLASSW